MVEALPEARAPALFPEEDLLPISALQHFLYCPRQCALIHLEQLWSENRFTAEGRILHAATDQGRSQRSGDTLRQTAMPVRSLALGLTGVVDAVEFQGPDRTPFLVEFKRGSSKHEHWDRLQLCAQALCLEEMLGRPVPQGALFYGKTRRREPVDFDAPLRALVAKTVRELRALLQEGRTPPPAPPARCKRCSLAELCRPEATRRRLRVADYLRQGLQAEAESEGGAQT